ncbi:MAG: universal stress protein [Nitrospinota bacterium]|nr:universal stress protein [Nitrospinota bacterium]
MYVLLDNSKYSLWSLDFAIELAKESGGTLIGNHAYAAKLHEDRFIQMEPGLPEKYQEPTELQKQRDIHGSLIEKGLELISDSYLDVFQKRCDENGVTCQRKMSEGKNYSELVKDIQGSNYDLVAMGARGLGSVKTTQLGSVCERVTRRIKVDTLIMKNSIKVRGGHIVVGIDGSEESFSAMRTAIQLNKIMGCRISALAVFDPDFHYTVFNSIAKVLSEEAGKVFKFKEQEKLHEEIIDSGLEKIYKDHLDQAVAMAKAEGVEVEAEVLSGKAFDALLDWIEGKEIALLLLGRVGVHCDNGLDIGSNAENLLRNADCNIMLFSSKVKPESKDYEKGERIEWEAGALKMLERVPSFVRNMVKGHIEANARKKGMDKITEEYVVEQRKKMMGR